MTPAPQDARRPFPVWAWVLIAVIVFALVVAGFVVFTSHSSGPSAGPSHSPTLSSSSSASPEPSDSTSALPSSGEFDSSMSGTIADILNSQNTSVLAQAPYFADPVTVTAAASDQAGPESPDQAVQSMSFMFTPGDTEPWDLALPESTLRSYRAGPYGSYFPVGAIVARSHDGHVFSFVGHDRTITAMYLAGSEDLLLGH